MCLLSYYINIFYSSLFEILFNFNLSPSRAHTLSKMEKKKGSHTGTMKPMSAHDEKTLNTAVAMANEITAK